VAHDGDRRTRSRRALDGVIGEASARLGGAEPTVLDWDSGLGLAEHLPGTVVFSPPETTDRLPYLDATVDLVVVRSPDDGRADEARRVARVGAVHAVDVGHLAPHFFPEWTGTS
jgi:hypothetical protein